LGFRRVDQDHFLEIAIFSMLKRDTIYRDNEGYNVSGARTRHQGLELDSRLHLGRAWTLGLSGSWTVHRYASDYQAAQGEQISSGNDVDSAPRLLANAWLGWRGQDGAEIELEWQKVGAYYLDASNIPSYPGHELLNFRLRQQFGKRWSVGLRITNLTDMAYADRADYAFGDYRYFPGRGRTLYADLTYYPGGR
jgi:iron complex outermembrane receptor protein